MEKSFQNHYDNKIVVYLDKLQNALVNYDRAVSTKASYFIIYATETQNLRWGRAKDTRNGKVLIIHLAQWGTATNTKKDDYSWLPAHTWNFTADRSGKTVTATKVSKPKHVQITRSRMKCMPRTWSLSLKCYKIDSNTNSSCNKLTHYKHEKAVNRISRQTRRSTVNSTQKYQLTSVQVPIDHHRGIAPTHLRRPLR